jgi:hypothetical protein
MPRLRWGPLAFVISVIALFIALGGNGSALTQANGSQLANRSASATTALPAWHNLTLTGGWTYGGYNSYHAAYYKDSQGIVHLRGSATGGSTSQAVFRLPPRNRPSHTLWLPVYAYGGSAGGLEIDSNGKAFLFDTNGGANVKGYSGLDGVSFRVP